MRHETEGKAHRYLPVLERSTVQDSALQRMTRKLFGGSPKLLGTRLLGEGELSTDQLRELRALVDERLAGREED